MRKALVALLVLLAPSIVSAEPPQTVQERLGYPADSRLLIIHADDLGMSHSVNRATLEALEKGWVTSASILVPCPWFPEVATWARTHPNADLGIHLALNSEWTTFRWRPVAPVDKVPSLLDASGYLPLLEPEVVARANIPEVLIELRAQVETVKKSGIAISHLDAHMGTLLRSPDLLEAYRQIGREYGLPILLERTPGQPRTGGTSPLPEALVDQVIDIAPGIDRDKWFDEYKKMLRPLPPGVYQLIVHLAYDDEEMRGATWDHPDWGAKWRQADLDLVKSSKFRNFLEDEKFILIRWKDLSRIAAPSTNP
jgi:predicted glycoside hydrolase/deacetylase ChbG (UPF0249 family)